MTAALRDRLRYAWLTTRRDPLWFPLALLVLFVFFVVVLRAPVARYAIARAYLGFLIPLTSGLLAAYALLDDAALELRFATPAGAGRTLVERLALILGMHAVCALVYQAIATALGIDLSPLGGPLRLQLVWLVPALALAALGTTTALAAAQSAVGAFFAGTVWIVELMMRGWCEQNAKSIFLFLGVFSPRDAALPFNQGVLVGSSLAFLVAGWRLLLRRERYLHGASE